MKIGIIEDDRMLNAALEETLKREGFETCRAFTCQEALRMEEKGEKPDFLLMDITLPDGNGIWLYQEILERQKQSPRELPAIFLTARDEEKDILEAFDAGADDYVVKPFRMKVLLRRIDAVLRRSDRPRSLVFEELEMWPDKKRAFCDGKEISLTPREYKLLEILMQNQGQVLTKEMLLEKVWGLDGQFVEENTLSVTIGRLRKKIGDDGKSQGLIKNIFGLGYRLGE